MVLGDILQNKVINTKQFGNIIESKFILESMKMGYYVSQTFGDTTPYDFILDRHLGKLERIQCKSLRLQPNGSFISETHRKSGHKRKDKVSYEGLIDFFFLYNIDRDIFAFVPVSESLMVMTFRLESETLNKKSDMRYIENYINF